MELPNIIGCFIGKKRVDGRKRATVSVVCCVRKKYGARSLAANQKVPKYIEWTDGTAFRGRLITDVQEIAGSSRLAAVAGPGDLMTIGPQSVHATTGVALRNPVLGTVMTTAAHAFIGGPGQTNFPGSTPSVQLATSANGPHVSAKPLFARWTTDTDFALVGVSGSPTNLFNDQILVRPPHWAQPADLGTLLFALTSRGPITLRFEGVTASLDIGGHPVDRMLLTTPLSTVTMPGSGDSGCCLVDDQFRLWGLLVGNCVIHGRFHFVFMSPHFLFADGSTLL